MLNEDKSVYKPEGKSEDKINMSLIVQIECWQNQRYRPLSGGWTVPISVSSFTDITGRIAVQFYEDSNTLVPKSSLPLGWEWFNEWKLDTSIGSDAEGWIYGTSFEVLIPATINKIQTGSMKSYSLVRRRRWIRQRICYDEVAKEFHQAALTWIKASYDRMTIINVEMEHEHDRLTVFEINRKEKHENSIKDVDNDLNDVLSMLEGVEEKLQMMVTLLTERGHIEAQYASQLDTLSAKWMFAGQYYSDSQVNDSEIEEQQKRGFFYRISTANSSVAQRLQKFSVFLSDSLAADVSNILLEIQSIKRDCTVDDGPKLRSLLVQSNEIAAMSLTTYNSSLEDMKDFIEYNQSELKRLLVGSEIGSHELDYRSSLSLNRPNLWIGKGFSDLNVGSSELSSSNASIAPPPSSSTLSLSSFTGMNLSFISGASNTKNTRSLSVSENIESVMENKTSKSQLLLDVFISFQLYHQSCMDWEANLYAYQAFINNQRKLSSSAISRVSTLLQTVLGSFASEQINTWSDSSVFIWKMTSDLLVSMKSTEVNADIANIQQLSNSFETAKIASCKTFGEDEIDSNGTNSTNISNDVSKSLSDLGLSLTNISITSEYPHNSVGTSSEPASPDKSNTSDSNLVTTTRLSISKQLHSSANYIVLMDHLKYCIIPKLDSISSNIANINLSKQLWYDGLVILTYDAKLHIIPSLSSVGVPLHANGRSASTDSSRLFGSISNSTIKAKINEGIDLINDKTATALAAAELAMNAALAAIESTINTSNEITNESDDIVLTEDSANTTHDKIDIHEEIDAKLLQHSVSLKTDALVAQKTFNSIVSVSELDAKINGNLLSNRLLSSITTIDVSNISVKPDLLLASTANSPVANNSNIAANSEIIFITSKGSNINNSTLLKQVLSCQDQDLVYTSSLLKQDNQNSTYYRGLSAIGLSNNGLNPSSRINSSSVANSETSYGLNINDILSYQCSNVSSVGLLLKNSNDASAWMKMLSNPFADVNIEYPDDSHLQGQVLANSFGLFK